LPCIGGFQIVRELGRGGMGIVYQAVREADGLSVAIKTIEPAVAVRPTQVRRFLREVDILRQLQHPNIISFYESGQSNGLLYFVMEYIDGPDASRYLKQRGNPLPVRSAVRMLCQLLAALTYAHDKGFVHRDIKPANLLVAGDDKHKSVKLADFGLARVYQASRMSGLTFKGDIGGTMAFMPPEQITHFRDVTPAADQYSAAATLYTLLTGRLLFDFNSSELPPQSVVLQEDPVPIRDRRSDVPEQLAGALQRALAKDSTRRFPNVGAFRSALSRYAR
jgi:serine/threonine protein kinase